MLGHINRVQLADGDRRLVTLACTAPPHEHIDGTGHARRQAPRCGSSSNAIVASSAAWSALTVAFTLSTSACAGHRPSLGKVEILGKQPLGTLKLALGIRQRHVGLWPAARRPWPHRASSVRASSVNSSWPASTHRLFLEMHRLDGAADLRADIHHIQGHDGAGGFECDVQVFLLRLHGGHRVGPPAGALAAPLAGVAAGVAAPKRQQPARYPFCRSNPA